MAASTVKILQVLRWHQGLPTLRIAIRGLCQKPESPKEDKSPAKSPESVKPNKPAGNEYNTKEYYQHNNFTYYDFEVEMEKDRLPQPSSLK